jgi:hypothetical protein
MLDEFEVSRQAPCLMILVLYRHMERAVGCIISSVCPVRGPLMIAIQGRIGDSRRQNQVLKGQSLCLLQIIPERFHK